MKKIGIITFHNAYNYGAVLQTYALQEKVKELGYDVFVINYRNKQITRQYRLIKYSRKNPMKCIKMLYDSVKSYSVNKLRYDKFSYFINEKLNLTNSYNSVKNLKKNYPKFDCYITGSDQVWNMKIAGGLSDAYTLNFGDDKINRISYAASIGRSSIGEKSKSIYKNKLSKINYISVREEDAKKELEKIVNKKIEVVLDPTLLLSDDEWDKKLDINNKIREKYILAYVVETSEEYKKILNYLSKKTGLRIIHFGKEKAYDNVLKSEYTSNPLEFVNLIKGAEYVVTTSFHATAFSIIYNKKFFVIPPSKTKSRITNLLQKLGIEDRIFYKLQDFENINYDYETDFGQVKRKLEAQKEKSIKFLKEAIDNKKDE